MDMKGAIAALDRALALEAAGKAENMVKTHAIWGGHHTLHAIGATFADEGFVGTKTWAHANGRSEERRVGKECRDRGRPPTRQENCIRKGFKQARTDGKQTEQGAKE